MWDQGGQGVGTPMGTLLCTKWFRRGKTKSIPCRLIARVRGSTQISNMGLKWGIKYVTHLVKLFE